MISVIFSDLEIGYIDSRVLSVGIKAISRLAFLRKFIFAEDSNRFASSRDLKISLCLCSQFLPRLTVAGMINYSKMLDFQDIEDEQFNNFSHDLYNPILRKPVHLSLQEIFLQKEVYLHPFCQLPQLQRVVWLRPEGDVFKIFNKFQTITELGFREADKELAKLVLQKVGWRLRKLGLFFMKVSVPEVLQLCPNLEFVLFTFCQFEQTFGSWPNNVLEEAVLHVYNMKRNPPSGFIKQVFNINKKAAALPATVYINIYRIEDDFLFSF